MDRLLDRRLIWCLAAAGVMWFALGSSSLLSQSNNNSNPVHAAPSLQVVASSTVNGTQQLVVLDQNLRSLAVYQVDGVGNLHLRSVRTLVWDLRMEEFNGQSPTPSELKRIQP